MRAFITTRLIDFHESLVWSSDPRGYAATKLEPCLLLLVDQLVESGRDLAWHHFDPKVRNSWFMVPKPFEPQAPET